MLIFVVVPPALAELPGTAAVANGCCLCTRICVPSASGAARFSASSAGAPPGAARRLDGVDDPITLVELVDPRTANPARDIDQDGNDTRRARRRSARRRRRRGRSNLDRTRERAHVPQARAADGDDHERHQSSELGTRQPRQSVAKRWLDTPLTGEIARSDLLEREGRPKLAGSAIGRCAAGHTAVAAAGRSGETGRSRCAWGIVKLKSAPPPGASSTRMVPPWASTRLRVMYSPSPAPGFWGFSPRRRNRSNTSARRSLGIPGPSSRTITETVEGPSATVTKMAPSGGEYFRALSIRFVSTRTI